MEDKRINKDEFNKILNQTLPYNAKDREFLKKAFEKDLSGGLTESELKSKMGKIKYNTKDEVDSFEADKLKNKLLGGFGK